MPPDKAGRVVFIGNIPYGLTEEQIIHTFSTVGQVLNFRLVYDRDTGRPKGFGFAEFSDADAAASAVRNLNDYEIMGRKLRVDFSHEGGEEDAAPAGYVPQPAPPMNGLVQLPNFPPPPQSNGLPPLPPGVDLAPNLTCPDAISRTLSTLPPPQLLDILSQMKGLVMSDPAKATELLKQAPQLSYAIFQALLLMGLVDTAVLASVVEQASQPPQPPQQTPQPQAQPYLPQPQPTYTQFPPIPGPTHVPTPPVQTLPYAPPPMHQQPPPAQLPSQEELLKQVLAMTPQQIDALPPAERGQIIMLRQQLLSRTGY
ncbi:MAG: hypothetical protein M1830_004284 [Pleopsidium flavum]|nr:MAG: hypothetical protein M1830_004284 [Pleopsidium flavum]